MLGGPAQATLSRAQGITSGHRESEIQHLRLERVMGWIRQLLPKPVQNTRYPLPVPELSESGPELPEPKVPDPKFG